MSAHYGYFDIGVYKNDGTPDEAKAREVFAWIQTNCPWFYDENVEVFVLDGHRISNNADFFCDGLYQVKDGDVPDNLDFLDDAYKAVKAEKIAATFLYDGSETSWHNNFFTASVWADGKRTDTYRSRKVSKDSDTFDFPDFVSISPEELVKGTKEEKKPQVDGEWEKPVALVEGGVVKKCLDKNAASVVIPAGVTEIGYGAFKGCTSLTSVEIPAGVTKIGDEAFWGCTSLASVEIPAGVTEIAGSAFEDCTSLASVEIPAGVSKISDWAFLNCTSLASVEIPAGVTEIAGAAFAGCKALASIAFGGTVKQWKRIEKGYGWNDSCPIITVHCSDGDVTEAFGDGK